MNLQVPPEAPWILHAGAAVLLTAHIGGGAMGMASGSVAMLAKKGSRLHRVSGTVFFVAMLCMAGVGAAVAPFLPEAQWTNTTAGVFTLYLISTGWMAVQRPPNQVGRFERAAMAVPLGIAAMALVLAFAAASGRLSGDFTTVYVIGALSALIAAADLRMIRRGGLAGPDRLARHLWRLGVGLFVAMGSFFLGQPTFVPQVLKDTGLNVAPVLFAVGFTLFWLVRVRFPRRRRAAFA
jgi:hypothetical protein